jgi:hypothetical protein
VDCGIRYGVVIYVLTIKFSYKLKQPTCKKNHTKAIIEVQFHFIFTIIEVTCCDWHIIKVG